MKTNNFKILYRRIGIVEIPGNEFVSLDWMDCCHAAFGEKSFVTAVIPGNGHRTAIQRTAFRTGSVLHFVLHFVLYFEQHL